MDSLEDRVARLEQRLANLNPRGPVVERDHKKGVRLNLGTAEKPCLSDWVQPGDRTGASRYVPDLGEQLMFFSDGGDWSQAVALPYTHSKAKPNPASDIDETVHHARDGQRHSVKKGHVKDHADKKVSRSAGDPRAKDGKARGGGDFPHEMQRQLAGMRAHLTQHDQNIAGLHDATSKLREIAQTVIPALRAVEPLLKGDATSLDKAVQGVTGKLEGYLAKTFQNAVGKLTNGFLDNIGGLVNGFIGAELGGLLDQVEALASAEGVEAALGGAIGTAVGEARGMVGAAAGGAIGPLLSKLDAIGALVSGSPVEGAFGALNGQLGGALGAAKAVAAGMGDLLDGQKNLTKGQTKSYRLGGYDGDD